MSYTAHYDTERGCTGSFTNSSTGGCDAPVSPSSSHPHMDYSRFIRCCFLLQSHWGIIHKNQICFWNNVQTCFWTSCSHQTLTLSIRLIIYSMSQFTDQKAFVLLMLLWGVTITCLSTKGPRLISVTIQGDAFSHTVPPAPLVPSLCLFLRLSLTMMRNEMIFGSVN